MKGNGYEVIMKNEDDDEREREFVILGVEEKLKKN